MPQENTMESQGWASFALLFEVVYWIIKERPDMGVKKAQHVIWIFHFTEQWLLSFYQAETGRSMSCFAVWFQYEVCCSSLNTASFLPTFKVDCGNRWTILELQVRVCMVTLDIWPPFEVSQLEEMRWGNAEITFLRLIFTFVWIRSFLRFNLITNDNKNQQRRGHYTVLLMTRLATHAKPKTPPSRIIPARYGFPIMLTHLDPRSRPP